MSAALSEMGAISLELTVQGAAGEKTEGVGEDQSARHTAVIYFSSAQVLEFPFTRFTKTGIATLCKHFN